MACTDAARIFFGNPGAVCEVYGNVLPSAEVERLIDHAREKTTSQRYAAKTKVATRVRSRISVPVDIEVKTGAGATTPLWGLAPGTRVYCPHHIDRRPSAFVVQSSHGKPGISCSACLVTMFPDGVEPLTTNEYLDLDLERLIRTYHRKENKK
jgi:hypothetical protein